MAKRDPLSDAAYEVVPGATAEEAVVQGLVVVEYAVDGSSMTPIYGRYLDGDTQKALPAVIAPEPAIEEAPAKTGD